MTHVNLRFVLPATLLAGALALTACGGSQSTASGAAGSSPSSPSTTAAPATPATGLFNAADVSFATNMIPHHGQAIEMARIAVAKASDPRVTQLATQIQAAQTPEIKTMSGWLTAWGKPVPDPSMSGMAGMAMGGMKMPGMMTGKEMARMRNLTGAAFDRNWLQMMVVHHRGAVAMARTELRTGQNAQAKALAQDIVDGQSKEIATMTALLKKQ